MKLNIHRSELASILGHVASIVERRSTIPILGNVLLRATPHRLSVHATDLERSVSDMAEADVSADGDVTVPALMLADIVRRLPETAEVKMELTDGRLTVAAGRAKFALPTLPAADFPDISPPGEFPCEFTLPAADLMRMLDTTKFAMSTEETRFYLNGVYLHANEGSLIVVATDGHRLAKRAMPCPAGAADMPAVIIPRKTVHELAKLLTGTTGDVTLSVSPSAVRVNVGDVVLTSKLIDGTFPDYWRVIPKGNDRIATLDVADLTAGVERMACVTSDRGGSVKLTLNGKINLSARNTDGAEAEDEIAADYDGPEMAIGFSARYLAECAGQIGGKTMTLALSEPGSPALMTDPDDAGLQIVLMPMRPMKAG